MHFDAIEKFEHEGIKCEIHYDDDPSNPYKEFDHASEILSDVKDYDLGGKVPHPESVYAETPSSAIMARYMTMFRGYALAIPWWFLDWGSGGAKIRLHEPDEEAAHGWLVLDQKKYNEEFAKHGIKLHMEPGDDKNDEAFSAEKTIRAEFSEFKAYIEGEVFGWQVAVGEDEAEGCWGYYGDLDYVRAEAKAAAEFIAHDRYVNTDPPDIAEVIAGMISRRDL